MSGAEAAPSIFLVDDDLAVVRTLTRGLAAEGFAVRWWSDGRMFLDEHIPSQPGCIVADVAMTGLSGLELQSALVSRGCPRPIVFISAQDSVSMSVQAMKAGAVTVLPKPVRFGDLLAAVREGIARDAVLRKDTERRLQWAHRLQALTPREREVLTLVVAGRMNKQIAAALGTAEKTIKVHRGRIMEKMQVRSLAELVLMTARLAESGAHATSAYPHSPPSKPLFSSGFGGVPPSQMERNARAKSSPSRVPFTAPLTST